MPMTLTATAEVPANEAGLASGLINTSRQMGGAIGLATLAESATQSNGSLGHSVRASLTAGYDRAFAVAGVLLIVSSALALFVSPRSSNVPTMDSSSEASTQVPASSIRVRLHRHDHFEGLTSSLSIV